MSDIPMHAEKYFAEYMKDPEFVAVYEKEYKRIKLEKEQRLKEKKEKNE